MLIFRHLSNSAGPAGDEAAGDFPEAAGTEHPLDDDFLDPGSGRRVRVQCERLA
jgi:hypothetical protein